MVRRPQGVAGIASAWHRHVRTMVARHLCRYGPEGLFPSRSSSTPAVAYAGLVLVVAFRAVFFPVVVRHQMLRIMVGMDPKDSYVARLWPTWCSWFRLHQTVDFPQLQSTNVVDISFVVQRLIFVVIETIEIPQWRVDMLVDAPLCRSCRFPGVVTEADSHGPDFFWTTELGDRCPCLQVV